MGPGSWVRGPGSTFAGPRAPGAEPVPPDATTPPGSAFRFVHRHRCPRTTKGGSRVRPAQPQFRHRWPRTRWRGQSAPPIHRPVAMRRRSRATRRPTPPRRKRSTAAGHRGNRSPAGGHWRACRAGRGHRQGSTAIIPTGDASAPLSPPTSAASAMIRRKVAGSRADSGVCGAPALLCFEVRIAPVSIDQRSAGRGNATTGRRASSESRRVPLSWSSSCCACSRRKRTRCSCNCQRSPATTRPPAGARRADAQRRRCAHPARGIAR